MDAKELKHVLNALIYKEHVGEAILLVEKEIEFLKTSEIDRKNFDKDCSIELNKDLEWEFRYKGKLKIKSLIKEACLMKKIELEKTQIKQTS